MSHWLTEKLAEPLLIRLQRAGKAHDHVIDCYSKFHTSSLRRFCSVCSEPAERCVTSGDVGTPIASLTPADRSSISMIGFCSELAEHCATSGDVGSPASQLRKDFPTVRLPFAHPLFCTFSRVHIALLHMLPRASLRVSRCSRAQAQRRIALGPVLKVTRPGGSSWMAPPPPHCLQHRREQDETRRAEAESLLCCSWRRACRPCSSGGGSG